MDSIDQLVLTPEVIQVISPEQAWYYNIVPVALNGSLLEVLIDDQVATEDIKAELETILGKKITLQRTPHAEMQKALGRFYRNSNKRENKGVKIIDQSEDFLLNLVTEAKNLGSSDIHIESFEEKGRIRMRIDGQLIERYSIKKGDYPFLINKIKIKANLDIAEKRLPQDGRIFFNSNNYRFDIRVSILPTLHGEKIVLRLLNKETDNLKIEGLGFSKDQLKHYLEATKKTNGIILISGPTGSGKTTTLYATLKIVNKERVNILTIEDPIEYTLEGINQVQLKEAIGLTFASALRTFLRQDPDVIMLGEIRDPETAQMAIRAALTGHLVLSTIHTNSAWGTVARLADMGVPGYLIANSLVLTVAQRLVRLLCPHCKQQEEFKEEMIPQNFSFSKQLSYHYTAKGCGHCYYTGYSGRKAVYEVIPIDRILANQIKNLHLDVANLLKERNISSLQVSLMDLVEKGETSIEEVYPFLLNSI